jgi:electron transfer flavoprotein alpha subunit
MSGNNVWTIAEQFDGEIRQVSHELLTRGRKLADKLGSELVSVLMGDKIERQDLKELILRGADRVYYVEAPELSHFQVETYGKVLIDLVEEHRPEVIIASATTSGRTLMPYVAVKMHTGLTADCTGLDIEEGTTNLIQTRPAIGGNILATIRTPEHRPQMATVRPRSTMPAPVDSTRKGEIQRFGLKPELLDTRVKRLGFQGNDGEDVDIQSAEVIVAGGRGLKKKENFALVHGLADKLDGAVGASREAVDRDWINYPHQVGLSGKTVTPKFYMAIGISGSIQHMAGMKTADTIVAINSDPEAQIFKVADFGIVGDLFEVVNLLNEKLDKAANQ